MLMDQNTSIKQQIPNSILNLGGGDALMQNEYKVYLMNRLARRQATSIIMKH